MSPRKAFVFCAKCFLYRLLLHALQHYRPPAFTLDCLFTFAAMTKKDRQLVHDMFGRKCAYCGTELTKGWHVDHIKPIRRSLRKNGTCRYPKRETINNCMPACASCNINKHQMNLEDFRKLVAGFMKHLNERNTQFKIAKRYGLVVEVDKPITFYFETFTVNEGAEPLVINSINKIESQ